ncbi:MAG: HNH endonuclease, partial [bacterium]|nr:HNH endonuclease [bacterium]
VFNWVKKLIAFAPVAAIQVETVRFDTQKLQNPEISGVQYQQGELAGYEVREYLLEKWGRKCAYCEAENVPLEVEHIRPKSRGGSNRVSNLTLSCIPCNIKKGNRPVEEFLAHDPVRLNKLLAQAKQPLKDAAVVNTTRYATGNALKSFALPVSFWSGGRTKCNRIKQGYPKDHWLDAACVGQTGEQVYIPPTLKALQIKAVGRGSRQKCRMDRFGFPRTKAKQFKRIRGFQTGDIVKAVVTKGKKVGVHIGRVAIRTTGSFRVGQVDGINWRYCLVLHRADGYEYAPTS